MDSYLESLVPKNEAADEAEIEAVEVASADIDEASDEAVSVPETNEPEQDSTASEPSEQESTDEEVAIEPEPEEPESPQVLEDVSEGEHQEGEIIEVDGIRVYLSPDTNLPAINVTGNVVYLGKICDFTVIQYMRHGFGLVRGYTLDKI